MTETATVCQRGGYCKRDPGWACVPDNSMGGIICTCETGRCGWDCGINLLYYYYYSYLVPI